MDSPAAVEPRTVAEPRQPCRPALLAAISEKMAVPVAEFKPPSLSKTLASDTVYTIFDAMVTKYYTNIICL